MKNVSDLIVTDPQRAIIGMLRLVHEVNHVYMSGDKIRIIYTDNNERQIINIDTEGYLVASRSRTPTRLMLIDPTPEGLRELEKFMNELYLQRDN